MTTIHNLTPSPLRTVTLQPGTSAFSQAVWCPKASADCLDYVLDFTALLAGTDDTLASIQSAVVTTSAGGAYDLKVMWSAVAGMMVVAFLASGQPSTTQKILFEITTAQGRVYSVMVVMQITGVTVATAPPSDAPVDALTNGKVLIAGVEALPSGYSSNGQVVMVTTDAAPVGTPSFESVTSETYLGDGSGLDVTSNNKTQTIGEWVAALASDGTQGLEGPAGATGAAGASAYQEAVTAGYVGTELQWLASLVGPAGPKGDTGASGPTGAQGPKGDTGAAGPAGSSGADGISIASIAVAQSPLVAGQSSTVSLTPTMSNGAVAPPIEFDAPAGAAGTGAELTAGIINTALGYTAANGNDYFPLLVNTTPDDSGNFPVLPSVVRTSSSFNNNGGLYTISDTPTSGPSLQIGLLKGYFNVNYYTIRSLTNNPAGLMLCNDEYTNSSICGLRLPDGTGAIQSLCFTVDGRYGSGPSGSYFFTNQDNPNDCYWKIQAYTNSSGDWAPNLNIFGGDSGQGAFQSTPVVSFAAETNQATFATEPTCLAYTAVAFAGLPVSPVAWQRAVVTDKAVGSGAQGVMVMWNPNTKTWTGLSGEALT